jgi:hypothetical protein
MSGVLNLSRNLGLITGASVMGAIFARASATTDIITAPSRSVAAGLHVTFAVATTLIIAALALASARPRGGAGRSGSRPGGGRRAG